ncbi:hypothetical protein FBU30_003250 [Linnemannia zychae]|nr:hypothetical protein FBU30_003250 [Linnemannia zychae]
MLSDATRFAATDDYGTTGSVERDLARKRATAMNMQASGSILGALSDSMIDDLIIPASESVGVRLLKKMGWKPGQGIGPRISRRPQTLDTESPSDDDTPANVTFAPIDSALIVFDNKTNHFGLGFDPHKDAPEFDVSMQSKSNSRYLSAPGSEFRGTRVGFGAMDDSDDEDGDDIYGDKINRRQIIERDFDIPTNPKKRQKGGYNDTSSSSSTVPTAEYCSDGRRPLMGFILTVTRTQEPKWYNAPVVPPDFNPIHTFSGNQKTIEVIRQHERPKLTADDRALVLGETPIDAPRRSVFEYISSENKHRLDNALGFILDVDGEKHMKKDFWEVPKLDKSVAEAALQGYIPFSDNIAKQRRYKQYLNVQAGLSSEKIEQVEGFSGEDMTKELNEFVQAARIFKPLSTSMSNRFTSASNVVEIQQPAPGLRSAADIQASAEERPTTPKQAPIQRIEAPKSQAAKAAEMGMFGPLTRSMVDFFPNKLLCKRFNVPDPHPEHKDTGPEAVKDLLDKSTMDRMMMDGAMTGRSLNKNTLDSISTSGQSAIESNEGIRDEVENEQTEPIQVVQERPPMDIFKAIFDDSDTDTDSDRDLDAAAPHQFSSANADVVTIEHRESHLGADIPRVEGKQEETPSVPFRPIFTKRSSRLGRPPSPQSNSTVKTHKVRVHEQESEESDDDQIGPRLDLSQRSKTAKKSSSTKKATAVDSDVSLNMTKGQEIALGYTTSISTSNTHDSSLDDFIGPPAPPSIVSEHTLTNIRESQDSSLDPLETKRHERESYRESKNSKRHGSPDAKRDDSERSKSKRSRSEHSSRSHRRSPSAERSSKSRRHRTENIHDSDGLSDSRHDSQSKRKHSKTHSSDYNSSDRRYADSHGDSKKKDRESTRHRKEHRSKTSDKDKEEHRSSSSRHHKHSRSDRRGDESTRDRTRRKHTDARQDDEDTDAYWVEKESEGIWVEKDSPSTKEPTEPTQSAPSSRNRPRAAAFF